MQLTLLVPELLWPEPGDRETLADLDCPALQTLLARGNPRREAPQSLEATLTDIFGLPGNAPYAALRLLGEAPGEADVDAGACWICADPVHLRFHQERLILADSSRFAVELEEAQTIVGELNRYFPEVGRFHAATADRWYLRLAEPGNESKALDEFAEFGVLPLSAMAGRRVERQLPETPHAAWLRKLLNEAQMLLHAHPVNAARESAGQPPINSLWMWGAGRRPARLATDLDSVWSSHPLALGLGRAAGLATHPAPAGAAAVLARAGHGKHALVVLDDLLRPVQYEDGDAYRTALGDLEKHWFAPLRQALRAGRLTRLHLVAPTVYGTLRWESRRADQWKIWRRPRPLAQTVETLAKGEA